MKENTLVSRIYRQTTINKMNQKIQYLGNHCPYQLTKLLNIRLFVEIILCLSIVILSHYGLILAPLITILFHYLSEYILFNIPMNNRQHKLEKEALYFFQVYLFHLRHNHNPIYSLELTTNNIHNDLSAEFIISLKEIKLGHTLKEALNNMIKRIPSPSIHELLIAMMDNDLESSLTESLKLYQSKQELKEKSKENKKLLFVMILSLLFIIPMIFLIIYGPTMIKYIIR